LEDGTLVIQDNDVVVASGITVLNFEGNIGTTYEGAGKVTVVVSGGITDWNVPEGDILQLGSTGAYPTTTVIRFGDVSEIYEKYDDALAIAPDGGHDGLIIGRDAGYNWLAKFGDIDAVQHGNYLGFDINGFYLAGAHDVTGAELEELTDGSETTLHSHAGGGAQVSAVEPTSYKVGTIWIDIS